MNWIQPPDPPYGKERRKRIKEMFDSEEDSRLAVNCKYRPQVKDDPDLKKLLKSGFLKQVRLQEFVFTKTHKGPFKKPGKRMTYLTKA